MKEEKFWILVSKKVAGEATAEELEQLRMLINNNPEWENVEENLQELWNSKPKTKTFGSLQKTDDAYLVHINRLKEKVSDFDTQKNDSDYEAGNMTEHAKKPFYARWTTYAIAATFITGVFTLYSFYGGAEKAQEHIASAKPVSEIIVSPGSRSKIQLPDGSQVWVNSGSRLTYENSFKGNTREVQLDGEAYFDVVKDASHPFIVHTSGIDIKVLGTAFNVKAFTVDPTIEATLIHGSIEVINKNQPGSPKVMLKPHEKLVYNKYPVADYKDQRADIKPDAEAYSITIRPLTKNIADSDIVETAWVYNKLIFEDEKFSDLAVRMENWFNLKINIETEKLMNYRISGSFVNETAEEALKELQFLVPFNYSINGNEVKIMKK